MSRHILILVLSALALSVTSLTAQQPQAELVSVEKIWDKAKHNGFTDITRFKNLFICAFREGDDHIGGDGQIRVLISSSGKTWVEQALVSEKGVDLRDPKLTIAPPEVLMLTTGGSIYNGTRTLQGRQPRVATSTDFKYWSPNVKALAAGDWLWRPAFNETDKKFYGVAYNQYPNTGGPKPEAEWSVKLYSSLDGKVWALTSVLNVTSLPSEATIRFKKDGTGVILMRRDGGDKRGALGVAAPPYRDWKWTPLPYALAGPNFIVLPDDSMVACTVAGTRLGLFKMTETALEPLLPLQSGGDCGYAGMVWEDGQLHLTYHSSHEGKTSIYYARVKLPWVK
ncbi:MAG: hypothetical protein K1X78_14310 [Verrucomicrobiaceae bacterium]|nr:hypothetical protein [Verrucomicrobiaceae bacterium]